MPVKCTCNTDLGLCLVFYFHWSTICYKGLNALLIYLCLHILRTGRLVKGGHSHQSGVIIFFRESRDLLRLLVMTKLGPWCFHMRINNLVVSQRNSGAVTFSNGIAEMDCKYLQCGSIGHSAIGAAKDNAHCGDSVTQYCDLYSYTLQGSFKMHFCPYTNNVGNIT